MRKNNVIIRGFISLRQIITKGYSKNIGRDVKICRLWTESFVAQSISTANFICQKIDSIPLVSQSLSSSDFIGQRLNTNDFISQKVSTT